MRLDDLSLWYLGDPSAEGRESTLDNAMSQCDAFGLSTPEAALEVSTVIDVVDHWQEHFARVGVTARDIDSLAQRIDGDELRAQRTAFDPARFRSAVARTRKPGPFQRS